MTAYLKTIRRRQQQFHESFNSPSHTYDGAGRTVNSCEAALDEAHQRYTVTTNNRASPASSQNQDTLPRLCAFPTLATQEKGFVDFGDHHSHTLEAAFTSPASARLLQTQQSSLPTSSTNFYNTSDLTMRSLSTGTPPVDEVSAGTWNNTRRTKGRTAVKAHSRDLATQQQSSQSPSAGSHVQNESMSRNNMSTSDDLQTVENQRLNVALSRNPNTAKRNGGRYGTRVCHLFRLTAIMLTLTCAVMACLLTLGKWISHAAMAELPALSTLAVNGHTCPTSPALAFKFSSLLPHSPYAHSLERLRGELFSLVSQYDRGRSMQMLASADFETQLFTFPHMAVLAYRLRSCAENALLEHAVNANNSTSNSLLPKTERRSIPESRILTYLLLLCSYISPETLFTPPAGGHLCDKVLSRSSIVHWVRQSAQISAANADLLNNVDQNRYELDRHLARIYTIMWTTESWITAALLTFTDTAPQLQRSAISVKFHRFESAVSNARKSALQAQRDMAVLASLATSKWTVESTRPYFQPDWLSLMRVLLRMSLDPLGSDLALEWMYNVDLYVAT